LCFVCGTLRNAALPSPNKFDVACLALHFSGRDCIKRRDIRWWWNSFSELERYIQQEITDKQIPYPEAVFVMTDGYGDDVFPQNPNRWHVFLTEGGSSGNFPNEVNTYDLSEFE
jgi:hypothetical protein